MPIPLLVQGITEGFSSIPYIFTVLKVAPWVLIITALKYYFGGARNSSERLMHSKVVMITGGTSGIGAVVAHELASRGAQIILLTQHSPSDIFLVEYIDDLRKATGNQLIYAEQVDLASLHSIRLFATKWIDNAPPRRLDMLILCASTAVPSSGARKVTIDGLDEEWQVNYLANYHLLSILSPALRAQPPHRDVRVIFTTCPSYIGAKMGVEELEVTNTTIPATATPTSATAGKTSKKNPSPNAKQNKNLFGLSKLTLMTFAHTFQSHLNAYQRPDGQPPCTRVSIIDPGLTRTPGTRRWLTGGTLWGLLLYLLTWPVWWLILKSPAQGAQSILYAAMEASFARGTGGWMIKECRVVDFSRKEVRDDDGAGKMVWEFSEKQVMEREKASAVRRAVAKKEMESNNSTKDTAASASASANANNGDGSKSGQSTTPGSRRSRKGK